MSYSSSSRSTFTGGGGQNNGNNDQKSGPSRLKNSSGTKKDADADEEYPKYANVSKDDADHNRYNSNAGSDGYNGAGYNAVVIGAPYYGGGGGGGYSNSSPNRGGGSGYGNSCGGSTTTFGAGGSGGYGNTAHPPYGGVVIHTNEVHLHHGPRGYEYAGDNRNNNDQRRRGGGGGGGGGGSSFFGNFFDRN